MSKIYYHLWVGVSSPHCGLDPQSPTTNRILTSPSLHGLIIIAVTLLGDILQRTATGLGRKDHTYDQ